MVGNVGAWDRVFRILVGLVALYAGRSLAGGWAWLLYVMAAIALLTGIVGYCPLYGLFHGGKRQAPQR